MLKAVALVYVLTSVVIAVDQQAATAVPRVVCIPLLEATAANFASSHIGYEQYSQSRSAGSQAQSGILCYDTNPPYSLDCDERFDTPLGYVEGRYQIGGFSRGVCSYRLRRRPTTEVHRRRSSGHMNCTIMREPHLLRGMMVRSIGQITSIMAPRLRVKIRNTVTAID